MPAPTGRSLKAALVRARRTAVGDAIMPGREVRAMSMASGVFSVRISSTVRSSIARTRSSCGTVDVMFESRSDRSRSRLNFTASASNGVSSWNVTSSRRVRTMRPSLASHSLARRGPIVPSVGEIVSSVS
jgi:hypothetical protein